MCIRDSHITHAIFFKMRQIAARQEVFVLKDVGNAVEFADRHSVSYTHLDVYKRQAIMCMLPSSGAMQLSTAGPMGE